MMAIPVDDFSPIRVGNTGATFAPQFLHKDGKPQPLDSVTITMKMKNRGTGTIRDATGTWVIDDAAEGLAHYAYSADDVAVAGLFDLLITLTKNGKPEDADTKTLRIKAANES
jgi:hypothetical protein